MKSQNTAQPQVDTVKSEQVLILPGYLFFVESIEIPQELESSEIPDFAELSLESIAPFPIEQLCWGYLYKSGLRTLLLYAAYHRRIKSDGFTDLDDYAWVVPDFATLYGARFDEDVLVLIEGHDSVSMMYFQSNTEVPKSVLVNTCTEPLTENSIQQLRSEIQGLPESIPTLHLRPAIVKMSENCLPTFKHKAAKQTEDSSRRNTLQTLSPTKSRLWQMDVRSVDFKKAEQSRRRMSSWIVRVTGWAAVFALVLTGVEGLLFASQSWLKNQLAKVETQGEAVLKVEEKQTLVHKLDQVAQNELRPIEMLEVANEIRLKLNLGIEYDSVVIEGENHITIEGKASSITALNRYVESLKNSGLFKLLDEQKPITRNGQTTFKVSLAYSPRVALPEETPNPDGESVATNVSTTEKGTAV